MCAIRTAKVSVGQSIKAQGSSGLSNACGGGADVPVVSNPRPPDADGDGSLEVAPPRLSVMAGTGKGGGAFTRRWCPWMTGVKCAEFASVGC
jgi:hypothetical protein